MKQQSPDLWNYMLKVLTGSGKLVENIFAFFDIANTQDYVPSMDLLSKISEMLGEVGASFAGMGQGRAQIAPQGMPQGMPPGAPPAMGQGNGQGMPQNVPQGVVGASQGNPQAPSPANGGM